MLVLHTEDTCGKAGSQSKRSSRILKQAEAGEPIAKLVRRHNITQTTFYRWKKKYGGLQVSDAKRLKRLVPVVYPVKSRRPSREAATREAVVMRW